MEKKKNISIKILCCYHKRNFLIKNDIIVPIHVGRTIAKEASKDGIISDKEYQWLLDNMIGDDTGDNISVLNRNFAEITAVYWAWKNYDQLGNPDYIGLTHYRRLFDLKNSTKSLKYNKNILKNLGLTYEYLSKMIEDNSVIIPKEFKKKKEDISIDDIENTFLNKEITFDKKYKNILLKGIADLKNNYLIHYGNIFILNKKQFFEYCEFIFNILFSMQKFYQNDTKRTLGKHAEILTSFYFRVNQQKYNIKKFKTAVFCNPTIDKYIIDFAYKITNSERFRILNRPNCTYEQQKESYTKVTIYEHYAFKILKELLYKKNIKIQIKNIILLLKLI